LTSDFVTYFNWLLNKLFNFSEILRVNMLELNLSRFPASSFSRNDDNSVTTNGIDDLLLRVENRQIFSELFQRRKSVSSFLHLVEQKLIEKFVSLQGRSGPNKVKTHHRKIEGNGVLRFDLSDKMIIEINLLFHINYVWSLSIWT